LLKKIIILFLVALMCLGTLTSCFIVINETGSTGQKPESTETEAKIEKIPAQTDVLDVGKASAEQSLGEYTPSKDFGNQIFTIVIVDDTKIGMFLNEESTYSRAVEMQRQLIMSKLNCKLYIRRVSYDDFLADVGVAHNSGTKYADLILVPQKCLGYLHGQGMIYKLNELYGDSFVEECYDNESKVQFSAGDGVYGIVGDSAITPGAYFGVYFNKDVANECGITELIYNSLENGTWTFDYMLSLKDACKEKYGDIITLGAYSREVLIESMFGASGMKYVNTGLTVVPTVADNGERFDGFVKKMKEVIADPSRFTYSVNAYEDFGDGKVLFYIDNLANASKIRGNYGIVPMPKYDEQQEKYYTYANENAQVFAVLKTNTNTEYVPDLLRAFNETSALVYDAWSRDLLDYALRDSKSYHMVRKIFDSISYDFAYVYGDAYNSVAESTYRALNQAVLTDKTFKVYVERQDKLFKPDMEKLFPLG